MTSNNLLVKLSETIASIKTAAIPEERKALLQPLIDYIKTKNEVNEPIRLNFICTHNSRRSHLSQIWAQTMADYYGIKNVTCYSGGTEAISYVS